MVPFLAVWSLFRNLYVLRTFDTVSDSLLAGVTVRCSTLILYIACPRPVIGHFSKKHSFLSLETRIWSCRVEKQISFLKQAYSCSKIVLTKGINMNVLETHSEILKGLEWWSSLMFPVSIAILRSL